MRKEYTIAIILIIVFSTLSISILAYEENRYSLIQTKYNSLNGTYNSLNGTYNSLQSDYNTLTTNYNNLLSQNEKLTSDYNTLQGNYNTLQTNYTNLQNNYNNLNKNYGSYQITYVPSTLIQNGTVHWRFYMLDGTIAEWTDPIDTYRSYITMQKPTKTLSLHNSYTGTDFSVIDLREYVTPDFFANVVSSFTDGKTDREFVQEVVNFKNQIVTYGSGLGDLYRWPVETLTEGRGQCGDTTILMASLFKAGENRAHYGLSIYITYCDANHIDNPQTMNHAIVEVKYSDGTYTLIETTANTYYTSVSGWSFQV